jgi:hypothetical protein
MSLFSGTTIISTAEPILLAAALVSVARRKTYKSFPAFSTYLLFRLVIFATLSLIIQGHHLGIIEKHLAYRIYYPVYWLGYLVGAGITFFVIQEVFQHLMSPLPGLRRLGLIAFRWVALTSTLIAVALSVLPVGLSRDLLITTTSGVMRSMSILELCLVAFIVLSMHTLQISPFSRDTGVALGLGLVAAADLLGSLFAFAQGGSTSLANYCFQIVGIIAIGVWITYFLRPETETKPAILPASSPLLRWNEVANALGHPPPNVALGTPNDFFLQDVEKAVDKVLKKNLANPVR